MIAIPELSLVVLIGPAGAGKSTFARKHFAPLEVASSDAFRALVSDDENDQAATLDAFEVLHLVVEKRLARGRLTVVDATNVEAKARAPLVALAKKHHVDAVAIVLDLPEEVCRERDRARPVRRVGPDVIAEQRRFLRAALPGLAGEGFRAVHVLSSTEELDAAAVVREPLRTDLRQERGPFDVIGDVHGCHEELVALLTRLGWELAGPEAARHKGARKAVFLGDLVDRGPAVPGVLKLVMGMVRSGAAICVLGNHDRKLLRVLRGKNVKVSHGLERSLEQLAREPDELRERAARFFEELESHYVLDDGRLVVAHAGLKQSLHGRASRVARDFALYGDTTGEQDEHGLPVRRDWAQAYRGGAAVVYGHTPVAEARWVNGTINIDTGCVFGGSLTALRWPERELRSVPAARVYYERPKPFLGEEEPG